MDTPYIPGSSDPRHLLTDKPASANMTYDTPWRYDTSGLQGPAQQLALLTAPVATYTYDCGGAPSVGQAGAQKVSGLSSQLERDIAALWGAPLPQLPGPPTAATSPYTYDVAPRPGAGECPGAGGPPADEPFVVIDGGDDAADLRS